MKWTQLAEIETLSGRRNEKTGELESYIIKRSDSGIYGCNCKNWIFAKLVNGVKPECKHIEWWRDQKAVKSLGAVAKEFAGMRTANRFGPAKLNGEALTMDDLTRADYGWMWDVINAHSTIRSGMQEKIKFRCLRWLKTKIDTPLEDAAPIQPQRDFRIKRMITLEE